MVSSLRSYFFSFLICSCLLHCSVLLAPRRRPDSKRSWRIVYSRGIQHAKLLYYSPPSIFYVTLPRFFILAQAVVSNQIHCPLFSFVCFCSLRPKLSIRLLGYWSDPQTNASFHSFKLLLLSRLCLFFRMHLWNLTVSLNWAKASFSLTWLFLFELVSIASAVVSVTFLVHSVVEFIWLICSCRFPFSSRSWLPCRDELRFIFSCGV